MELTHFTYDRQAADKNEIMHKEVSLSPIGATFFSGDLLPLRLWSEAAD